jgi:hypothetical protein
MTTILAIDSLTKTYKRGVRANDGVTLWAEAGQVYGVLGPRPNGCRTGWPRSTPSCRSRRWARSSAGRSQGTRSR